MFKNLDKCLNHRSSQCCIGCQTLFSIVFTAIGAALLVSTAGCAEQAEANRAEAVPESIQSASIATTVAQSQPAITPETSAKGVSNSPLSLEPAEVDFGLIQKGTTATTTVRLTNITNKPIRIIQAKTSCGCTIAEVSKDPFDPGESIEVTVRFKPGGKVGARSTKTVQFFLEGDFEPIPLSVTGKVAQFVTIKPGQLDSPIAEDRTIVLRSTDGQPFRVLGATPPILMVNSEVGQEKRLEQQVVVSAQQWSDQNSPRRVEIKLDHPVVTSIALAISRPRRFGAAGKTARSVGGPRSAATQRGNTPGTRPLQLVPRRLNFGRLDAKMGAVRTILIRGVRVIEGVEPKVSIDSERVRVQVVGIEQTSSGLLITIRLDSRAEQSGTLQGTLYVAYDGAQGGAELYGSIELSKGLESQASSGDPQ